MLKKRNWLALLIVATMMTGLLSAVFAEEIATTEAISTELTEPAQDVIETPVEAQNDVTENAQASEVPSVEPEMPMVQNEEKDAETVAETATIEVKEEAEEVKEVIVEEIKVEIESQPTEEQPEVTVTEETKVEETKVEEAPVEEIKEEITEEVKIEETATQEPETKEPEVQESQSTETVTEIPEVVETEEIKPEEPAIEEAPVIEQTIETPAEETVETEEPETAQETEEIIETENEDEPVKFTGKAFISVENNGILYYGDRIILKANVEGANMEYSIIWEASEDGEKWERVGTGEWYAFDLTAENASRQYRIILNSK